MLDRQRVRPFTCPICPNNRAYTDASSLRRHLLSLHFDWYHEHRQALRWSATPARRPATNSPVPLKARRGTRKLDISPLRLPPQFQLASSSPSDHLTCPIAACVNQLSTSSYESDLRPPSSEASQRSPLLNQPLAPPQSPSVDLEASNLYDPAFFSSDTSCLAPSGAIPRDLSPNTHMSAYFSPRKSAEEVSHFPNRQHYGRTCVEASISSYSPKARFDNSLISAATTRDPTFVPRATIPSDSDFLCEHMSLPVDLCMSAMCLTVGSESLRIDDFAECEVNRAGYLMLTSFKQ
ncbi:unnamed protein product [Protopolystoma xenopodis]|uniref:Uncharacterized protein n=1 Tax=Protopolystoma xenopodis TaxID=117903 RepID=A0A448WHJ9_9PLAT|nr:unnamed protein product [Protopolystoma xenopodis]